MYGFIVNPLSGKGRSLKIWRKIERMLTKKNISYQVLITQAKEDLQPFIQTLKKSPNKVKAIVTLGGDGTIHEVVNHLAGTSLPLKVIPTGSGNDFARSRGITKNIKKEIEILLKGNLQKTDLLQIGDRHCMTVIGLGFDGTVAKVTNEMKFKKWLGSLSYVVSVFKVLKTYQPTTIQLTINGEEKKVYENVWLVAIANHPYYGGGMKICPKASSVDGKLDICIIHSLSKWKLLLLFPDVFRGRHIINKGVETHQADFIHVESATPMYVHGDGEMLGNTPASVSIKKASCSIIS